MRRVLIWLALVAGALAGAGVYLVKNATEAVSLPEVNNSLAERGARPRSFRCQSPSSETAAEAASRAAEAEFYQAIIRAAPYTDMGNALVVERLTVQVPAHRRFVKWDQDASGLLLDAIDRCVTLNAEQFSPGVRLIDTADVQGYLGAVPARSHVRLQVFAFSRARFDEAGRHAVVYYDRFCNGCGIGEYVWFRREDQSQPWRIAAREWGWIN